MDHLTSGIIDDISLCWFYFRLFFKAVPLQIQRKKEKWEERLLILLNNNKVELIP